MPNSMTAYARTELQQDWGTLVWEVRSVNHRYLETNFRMPETLRELEIRLRDIARNTLNRGKLDCSLQMSLNRETDDVAVNLEKARLYISAAHQIAELMTTPAATSPIDILKWPGVLEQREVDSELLKNETLSLFQQALDQLSENRALEGGKLRDFILQRVENIGLHTARVRSRMPEILTQQKQKLKEKIDDITTNLDPERLEQEIVIVAQKADVDEELDRLEAHLEEIRRVLNTKGPIGRRLDFLMQELNREANTLSSKSIAIDTTQSAVELKVLIEQMREQIQNIE